MIYIISFGFAINEANSQQNEPITFRHVEGIKGVELTLGVSDLGVTGSAYFSRYFTHQWYGKIGGSYETNNSNKFDSRTISIDVIIARSLVVQRSFFLSVLAGPTFVIEKLDGLDTASELNSFGIGLMGGAEAEYYLSDRLAVIASAFTRYVFNSDLGNIRLYATLGVKITF